MASIRKRGKNFQIRVSCGNGPDGKPKYEPMTYKPEPGMTERQKWKEAERQAVLFEDKCKNGLCLDESMKLYEFIEKWFSDYGEQQLKARTLYRYKDHSKRVIDALGHIRLSQIRPHHLIEFYNMLQKNNIRLDMKYTAVKDIRSLITAKNLTQAEFCRLADIGEETLRTAIRGKNVAKQTADKIQDALDNKTIFRVSDNTPKKLSNKTIRNYHAFISSVLSTAVNWQLIPSNPCERVKPPKVPKKEAEYMEDYEAQDMLDQLSKRPLVLQVLVVLVTVTGMRRGELGGLEWIDIGFENCLINVERASLYIPHIGIFDDTPKNESSKRIMKVPKICIDLLKRLKTEQDKLRQLMGDQWHESGKVFVQRNGKPIHPDTLTKMFKKFADECGDPTIHLHSMRHTNASLLIAGGTNLQTVAKRLGHSSVATTETIYSHAIRKADEKASSVIDMTLDIKL